MSDDLRRLIRANYGRLKTWANSVSGRDDTYFEQLNGHILLNSQETKVAMQNVTYDNHAQVVRLIQAELRELGEMRMVPTLGPAPDSELPAKLVVYLTLPTSE